MLTSNNRMVVLDGSRGFAALFVVLAHGLMTYRLVPLATVAVDYFFVLSGLVLASAYGARLCDGSMTFGRFFVVRFVRLYPMITLGVIMGAMVFLRSQWLRLDEAHLDRLAAAIAAEIFFLPLPGGFLMQSVDYIYPLNLPSWSLLFEAISNFLYAPLAAYLTVPRLLVALIVFGAGFAGAVWTHSQSTLGVTLEYFSDGLLRVAYSFTAGLVIYRLMRPGLAVSVKWLPLLMLIFVAIVIAPFPWGSTPSRSLYLFAVLLAMPAMVFLAAHMHPGPKLAAACAYLGRLSYPLYLAHFPVVQLFNQTMRHTPMYGKHLIAFVCLQMLCAFVAGNLALRLFDEPVRAWLGKRLLRGLQPQSTSKQTLIL